MATAVDSSHNHIDTLRNLRHKISVFRVSSAHSARRQKLYYMNIKIKKNEENNKNRMNVPKVEMKDVVGVWQYGHDVRLMQCDSEIEKETKNYSNNNNIN